MDEEFAYTRSDNYMYDMIRSRYPNHIEVISYMARNRYYKHYRFAYTDPEIYPGEIEAYPGTSHFFVDEHKEAGHGPTDEFNAWVASTGVKFKFVLRSLEVHDSVASNRSNLTFYLTSFLFEDPKDLMLYKLVWS